MSVPSFAAAAQWGGLLLPAGVQTMRSFTPGKTYGTVYVLLNSRDNSPVLDKEVGTNMYLRPAQGLAYLPFKALRYIGNPNFWAQWPTRTVAETLYALRSPPTYPQL